MTPEAILKAHHDLLRQRMTHAARAGHRLLVVEDTTTLPFNTREHCEGLGPIGEDFTRGLFQHNTLVLAMDGNAAPPPGSPAGDPQPQAVTGTRVLGLLWQEYWARDAAPESRTSDGRRRNRSARRGDSDAETDRWARGLNQNQDVIDDTLRAAGPDAHRAVYVADRESDIFGVLRRARTSGCDVVVRAKQNRKLVGEEAKLLDHVSDQPVREQRQLEVRGGHGKKARVAELEVRWASVSLRSPQAKGRVAGAAAPLELNLLELRETDASAEAAKVKDKDRVCWRLLTSLPVTDTAAIDRVVGIYRRRWLVEELHKALKTGLKLCESQLRDADAIRPLATMKSVVAAELLDLRQQAREAPDAEVSEDEMDDAECAVLEAEYGPPPGGVWRVGERLRRTAMLGGFMGRKGDGVPGWLTIWRGRQKLDMLTAGYRLARGEAGPPERST